MSSTISITLDSETDVFFPNSEVHGTINFTTKESNTVKQITVSIIGCARTYSEYSQYRSSYDYDYMPFTGEEIYMNFNEILWKNHFNQTLSNHENYKFPFKFTIPPDAPSNISEKYGEIQYYVKAKVEFIGRKKDAIEYHGFSVCSIIDLNLNPKLKLPVTTLATVNEGNFLGSKKELKITMNLPKTGYVCGEIIPLKLDICNKTSMKIKKIEYGIALKCFFSGLCDEIKFLQKARSMYKKKSLNVLTNFVEPSLNSDKYNIQIPPLSPSYSENAILKIQYFIFVKIHTDAIFQSGPSTSIPITIGNVPIIDESMAISASKILETAKFIEGMARCEIKKQYFNKNKEGPIGFRPKFAYYSNLS